MGMVCEACGGLGRGLGVSGGRGRLAPPKRLLRLAVEAGCLVSIDTDAHAPGQRDWLDNGCSRAADCGVPAERVLNTWPVERLLARAR